MGISIIWIILHHYNGLGIPGFDNVMGAGWIGVDIFFFVSAIGLSFSLNKNSDIISFYKRRTLRIIPTYWLIITFFLFISIYESSSHPNNILEGALYYTGLGWWLQFIYPDYRQVCYEWYIPTLLLFYVLAPFIWKACKKHPYQLLSIASLMLFTSPFYHFFDAIDRSVHRLPVFIYGFIVANWIIEKKQMPNKYLIIFTFFIGLSLFAISKIVNIDRTLYISIQRFSILLLMPLSLTILCLIIEKTRTNRIFSFIGLSSLELYLIHIYDRPLNLFNLFISNHAIAVIAAILLCVVCAYSIHIFMLKITSRVLK